MEEPRYAEAMRRVDALIDPEQRVSGLGDGFAYAILHFDDGGDELWLEVRAIKGMRNVKRATSIRDKFRPVTVIYTDFGKEFEVRETLDGVSCAMSEALGLEPYLEPAHKERYHERR